MARILQIWRKEKDPSCSSDKLYSAYELPKSPVIIKKKRQRKVWVKQWLKRKESIKHMQLIQPAKADYRNYKGFYSIVLMALTDYDDKFT